MDILEATRRDIIDTIDLEGIVWHGRLDDASFLGRLFDLEQLPSNDHRFETMANDVWQHRINNPNDWDDDWVFYDDRLNLQKGDDKVFLDFLCMMLHPIVRSQQDEVDRILDIFNLHLIPLGFKIVSQQTIANRSTYHGVRIGSQKAPIVDALKKHFDIKDESYVFAQISRMEVACESEDYDLAIGTAKELVESVCRTILHEAGIADCNKLDMPKLVKATAAHLKLTPDSIDSEAKAAETIRILLNNLANITAGLAYLRNEYGTGHGKYDAKKGLSGRHAKLAIGAASTLSIFLYETYKEQQAALIK